MKKAEFIKRYGEAAWKRMLEQKREYKKAHQEEKKASDKKDRDAHPEQVKEYSHERTHKGGKYYEKMLEDNKTGLQGEKNKIRHNHGNQYRPFKEIIAPDSQLHHQWKLDSAEYTGVALVEAKPHQYGIIDVIVIVDGEITVLTEEEVRKGKKNEDEK